MNSDIMAVTINGLTFWNNYLEGALFLDLGTKGMLTNINILDNEFVNSGYKKY
jgi:hypothetical protein